MEVAVNLMRRIENLENALLPWDVHGTARAYVRMIFEQKTERQFLAVIGLRVCEGSMPWKGGRRAGRKGCRECPKNCVNALG